MALAISALTQGHHGLGVLCPLCIIEIHSSYFVLASRLITIAEPYWRRRGYTERVETSRSTRLAGFHPVARDQMEKACKDDAEIVMAADERPRTILQATSHRPRRDKGAQGR